MATEQESHHRMIEWIHIPSPRINDDRGIMIGIFRVLVPGVIL